MNKKGILFMLASILATLLFSSACSVVSGESTETSELDENVVDMANPAAVYCDELGYSMEYVERNGGADADCIFPDGSRCAQWDFLSGRCGQEFTYCEMQGNTIEEGSNIGTCRFSDGSSCAEYLYIFGDCSPGDNPGEVSGDEMSSEEETPTEEVVTEIKNFVEARDFLAAYFLTQYGIETTEPWMETDITPEDAGPSTTYRYVSGMLTIVITAEAAAPYAPMYTIEEAAYIANGFYWEGTVSFDGTITEIVLYPPGTVLNEEEARDAILEFLGEMYGLTAFGEWADEGLTQNEDVTLTRTFSSDLWVVVVTFEPAAPLVPNYQVTVENTTEGIRWEGEITLRGAITEISFSE